ncbi:hypothetical protein [Ruegeria lacuscaerulensis]|uniref:hypothetical protein n=1 Tax=Ruegeria lacuscaerulensis TaxID=55218 RepID=UPI00148189F2|nr:hypothetical protein [Ruegeria lacuscaerulensis]
MFITSETPQPGIISGNGFETVRPSEKARLSGTVARGPSEQCDVVYGGNITSVHHRRSAQFGVRVAFLGRNDPRGKERRITGGASRAFQLAEAKTRTVRS